MEKHKQQSDILGQKGIVVWLTGLPGSGKSTLATGLEARLLEMNKLAFILDGDVLRKGLNSDLGFSDAERNENIRRVAEVAALFREASIITIVAFISPFRKMREFARIRAGKEFFIEVFVKASLATCIERDPKGMYKKAIRDQIKDFTGISSPYEEPESPDLTIDTETLSVEESIDLLLNKILQYTDKLPE